MEPNRTQPQITNMQDLVTLMKAGRKFNADEYLDKKRATINEFFRKNGLDSAVVGLSGGVDSAVTLMLLLSASDLYGSPIKKIVAVIAPIRNHGTTGQDEATNRALRLVKKYNFVDTLESVYCDLRESAEKLISHTYRITYDDRKTGSFDLDDVWYTGMEKPSPWVTGQMDSVLRTPVFYMQAARLQEEGYKSLVVGTTNRDEGSYIGFYGKASDGMVDLQPIADIHKSEVYALARKLGVTEEIINEKPRGDVWDGRVDEQMIGAPYWFLEMYLNLRMHNVIEIENLLTQLKEKAPGDWEDYLKYSKAIEALAKINAHKYQVGSPAHFIDVMPRYVPGGWSNENS